MKIWRCKLTTYQPIRNKSQIKGVFGQTLLTLCAFDTSHFPADTTYCLLDTSLRALDTRRF
ncbi:MAG: hypothetical protein JW863_22360 [Chitinispirillaceae bacterium]|nr:hypothetical protein [Chitinispirillaceae bacterium]